MSTTTARVDIILRALGAGDVKTAFTNISVVTREMATSLVSLAAGGGALSVFTRLATGAASLADRMGDLAGRVDATFEGIQVLDYLARRTGQSVDIFTGAIDRLRLQIAKARDGSIEAYEPFRRLNLTLSDFDGLKAERQLEVIARAVADATDKQAAFLQVSEILGVKVTPELREALLRLGEGYTTVANEADRAGQIMTQANAKALADARKQWEDYGRYLLVWWTEHGFGPAMQWLQGGGGQSSGVGAGVQESLDLWARAAGAATQGELEAILASARSELERLEMQAQVYAQEYADRRAPDPAADEAEKGTLLQIQNIRQVIAQIESGAYDERIKAVAAQREAQALTEAEAEAKRKALEAAERARIAEAARLKTMKEMREIERQQAREQLALTKRTLEANAQLGGQLYYDKDGRPVFRDDLSISSSKQPAGGLLAGEQSRDVAYERTSMGDAIGDARMQLEQMGNIFDGIYQSIISITTGIQRGVSTSIEGLILRTMSWRDALQNVGSAILTSIVSAFATMVSEWLVSQLAMWTISKLFKAKDAAATTAQASAATAAWSPAAIAANMATFGAAGATGLAGFLAALSLGVAGATAITAAAGTAGIAAYAQGGDYRAGVPRLVGEFGPELDIPRESGVIMNHRETAAIAAALGAGSGAAGGQGARARDLVLVDSRREAERIRRGSQAEVDIVEIVRAHKYQIFGS